MVDARVVRFLAEMGEEASATSGALAIPFAGMVRRTLCMARTKSSCPFTQDRRCHFVVVVAAFVM